MAQVQSLVRELRSRKPKKKKKNFLQRNQGSEVPFHEVTQEVNTFQCSWGFQSISGALFKKLLSRVSLVAQWLRIRLPMQGTRVRALVQEDPTCRGATNPVCHNY